MTPRDWSPHMWDGADYFAFQRLLWHNRFAVEPRLAYVAGVASVTTFANTVLRWVQHARHGHRVRAAVVKPPLFVLGHWRTGTTLLHELLILDDRHAYPTTAHCFLPCAPLLTAAFLKRFGGFLMPDRRPMDNMPAGWDRPQEDEFALCLLGQPSTYADLAFPNRPGRHDGALDLSGLSPSQLAAWKRALARIIRTAAAADPRRLVLKSPPHTARLPVLLEMFPDAQFIHIVRNPYELFASTVKLWKALAIKHGFQAPRRDDLFEEKVFREFGVIYDRYFEAKSRVPAGNLIEVRYETFTKDLVGGTAAVYDGLNLGGFGVVRPRVEAYAARNAGYERNAHPLSAETRAKVRARWGANIDRLGYAD